ncbi:hypothetical protein H6G91_17135 [Nostoc muscorum FACHB-395]|jgi:hypothetical protein|nr:hypothetical protein [Desmonostoc muscorum FACHB-395]
MEATTIRLTEKLMENHYRIVPDFFEQDGAMTYCFTAKNTKELEIAATLHVYEHSMELRLEYYKPKANVPFEVKEESITTFKELTLLIKNA